MVSQGGMIPHNELINEELLGLVCLIHIRGVTLMKVFAGVAPGSRGRGGESMFAHGASAAPGVAP